MDADEAAPLRQHAAVADVEPAPGLRSLLADVGLLCLLRLRVDRGRHGVVAIAVRSLVVQLIAGVTTLPVVSFSYGFLSRPLRSV